MVEASTNVMPYSAACFLPLKLYANDLYIKYEFPFPKFPNALTLKKMNISLKTENHGFLWTKYDMSVGKISTNFTIILEVVPPEKMAEEAIVAFDNIQLFHCYQKKL
ncbi:hypothetical protein NQ317_007197 [Molorchus minor]|uniref:Uncharacterized protein n=1 Tax=Molorchus minor TaxID=1323400 RepID=A0ABQ9JP83_9CUCU|nr:hypothetical protein NQ317_007197 [Molorchus minor]